MRRALFAILLTATACGGEVVVPSRPEPSREIASGEIAAWGDSMTQGFGPDNYPSQLAVMLGRPVYNGGITGETSAQVLARFLADTAHRGDAVVLWMGRNNLREPYQVLEDIASAVARVRNARREYVVLSIHNKDGPRELAGGPDYAIIMAINAQLAASYPEHFLDVRSYLVSQYDPSKPQDVLDHEHDLVPLSLRRDQIHLSPNGNELVARKVAEYALAHRW